MSINPQRLHGGGRWILLGILLAVRDPSFFTWGASDVHGVGEVAVSLHRGKGCLHGCHVGFTWARG